MNVAHYEMQYGALPLEEQLMLESELSDRHAELVTKAMETNHGRRAGLGSHLILEVGGQLPFQGGSYRAIVSGGKMEAAENLNLSQRIGRPRTHKSWKYFTREGYE